MNEAFLFGGGGGYCTHVRRISTILSTRLVFLFHKFHKTPKDRI